MPKNDGKPEWKEKIKDIYGNVYFYYYYYYDDEMYDENYVNNPNKSSFTRCVQQPGILANNPNKLAYKWNGLPIHTNLNDKYEMLVVTLLILSGFFILFLSGFCIFVLRKNSTLSKATKFILIFDECCKISTIILDFYSAQCVLTWNCVQTEGFLPGILLNQILLAIFSDKSEWINHGFSILRVFHVFLDGRYSTLADKFCIPYCIFAVIFPSVLKLVQISRLQQASTGYTCYGGYFFSPLDLSKMLMFESSYVLVAIDNFLTISTAVMMVIAFLADIFIGIKIWKMGKGSSLSSDSKRKALIRLTILLMVSNLIWSWVILYDFSYGSLSDAIGFFDAIIVEGDPLDEFFVSQGLHFFGNTFNSLITIIFTLWTKSGNSSAKITPMNTNSISKRKNNSISSIRISMKP